MSAKPIATLDVRSRNEWRKWLEVNHASRAEIWLIFHKRHTGVTSLGYNDAVEEALCFGWIDSLVRRLDDARYARKFTPRKARSKWSAINRRRYTDLASRGLLAEPGLQRAPTSHSSQATSPEAARPSPPALPSYIESALKTNPRAWQYFEQLAPSYRRAYIGWIDSAKRDETKDRRLREVVNLLAAGKKLGLK